MEQTINTAKLIKRHSTKMNVIYILLLLSAILCGCSSERASMINMKVFKL